MPLPVVATSCCSVCVWLRSFRGAAPRFCLQLHSCSERLPSLAPHLIGAGWSLGGGLCLSCAGAALCGRSMLLHIARSAPCGTCGAGIVFGLRAASVFRPFVPLEMRGNARRDGLCGSAWCDVDPCSEGRRRAARLRNDVVLFRSEASLAASGTARLEGGRAAPRFGALSSAPRQIQALSAGFLDQVRRAFLIGGPSSAPSFQHAQPSLVAGPRGLLPQAALFPKHEPPHVMT